MLQGREDGLGRDDRVGVGRAVDRVSGVHRLFAAGGRRVGNQRHVIAELHAVATGGLDTRVREDPDEDDLLDAVQLKLLIEVGVREAAGGGI